jgi:hypothetical protein
MGCMNLFLDADRLGHAGDTGRNENMILPEQTSHHLSIPKDIYATKRQDSAPLHTDLNR